MKLFSHIKDTHDNIMTSSGLSSTQNAAEPQWLFELAMALDFIFLLPKFKVLHAVSQQIWEKFLELILDWKVLFMENDIALSDLS